MSALTVAIFPGAGSVHLYHAVDAGLFAGAGLDVTLHEVTSSAEQIQGWNDGRFELMHTSPDHLLRGACQRDPVILRAEAIGELSVHARSAVDPAAARWAWRTPPTSAVRHRGASVDQPTTRHDRIDRAVGSTPRPEQGESLYTTSRRPSPAQRQQHGKQAARQ